VVAGNRSVSFLDPDGNRVEIACNANKFKFDNRRRASAATNRHEDKEKLTAKGAKNAKKNSELSGWMKPPIQDS
jgi:hypothetical protein